MTSIPASDGSFPSCWVLFHYCIINVQYLFFHSKLPLQSLVSLPVPQLQSFLFSLSASTPFYRWVLTLTTLSLAIIIARLSPPEVHDRSVAGRIFAMPCVESTDICKILIGESIWIWDRSRWKIMRNGQRVEVNLRNFCNNQCLLVSFSKQCLISVSSSRCIHCKATYFCNNSFILLNDQWCKYQIHWFLLLGLRCWCKFNKTITAHVMLTESLRGKIKFGTEYARSVRQIKKTHW